MRSIDADALLKFPIRADQCDEENANEHFINGVETVMEYAKNLPTIDAIPISFIEAQIKEANEVVNKTIYKSSKAHKCIAYATKATILKNLLAEWDVEKENDK